MEKNENIEIIRIIDLIKSKRIIILFVLVISILLGYFYSYHCIEPKYKATSTLLLIPNNTSETQSIMNTDLSINSELIETYRSIGENSKILKQVIQKVGLDMTEQQLLEKMKINVIEDTYMIEVSAISRKPEKARDIVREFDTIFLQEIKQIYHLNNIGIVDEAELPEKPYNINHIKDMILFFWIGIGMSFIYIMLIYLLDNTIKKEEDIEKYIQIKSLGNIPIYKNKKEEIVNRENAKSYITECINTIRTNILYRNSTKNAKTMLITSCTPQEGKSWVSSNIAIAFAQTNQKILLIDADMRKGRLHKIFKLDNKEGLSNYLTSTTETIKGNIEIEKDYIKKTNIPNLHIITNGSIPPNPSELIETSNMKELLENFKNSYDMIIIDAPPCKLVTDSIVLSTIVDSTILVANSQKTKIKDFYEVKKAIEMVGGEIIGAILNKKKIKAENYNRNYYYEPTNTIETNKEEKSKNFVEEEVKQALLKEEKEEKSIVEVPLEEHKNYQEEDIKTFIYDRLQELQNNLNITQEMIRKIQENNHEAEIELLVNEKITQLQEEIAKMNYQNQMEQISEMLIILKDNYLALSNKIEKQEVVEEEIPSVNKGKNIIDFKAFKRQRNKKKVYSIKEDIYYEDLEQTATYVIPLTPFMNKLEKTM